MVGFRDLVGTDIAPVSKKTAVNRLNAKHATGFLVNAKVIHPKYSKH